MKGTAITRVETVFILARRGIIVSLYKFGIYLTAFISCLTAVLLVSCYQGAIRENGLLVLNNPLNFPLQIVITINAVYLAATAAMSISKERDTGMLEVLFYGPVETGSYITAKYVEQMFKYVILLGFYGLVFILSGKLTNFNFSSELFLIGLLSLGFVSSVISLGILISAVTSKTRSSFFIFLILALVFSGVQLLEFLTANTDINTFSPVFASSITILNTIARLIRIVSPFSSFGWGMEAIRDSDFIKYFNSLATLPIIYLAVCLFLSKTILDQKGIKAN